MKKKILTAALVLAALLLPVAATHTTTPDARGGFGEWPFTATK